MIRDLTEDDVEFTITAEEEDIPIRGSFDSGDVEADEAMAKDIEEDFNSGNEWAWCCVNVTGKWEPTEDVSLVATAYLGGCSYKSKRDFLECNDYVKDMKAEVLAELNKKLHACAEAMATLDTCTQGENERNAAATLAGKVGVVLPSRGTAERKNLSLASDRDEERRAKTR